MNGEEDKDLEEMGERITVTSEDRPYKTTHT